MNPKLSRVAYKTRTESDEVPRKHKSSLAMLLNLSWRLLFPCMKDKIMMLHLKRNYMNLLRKIVPLNSRKMEVVEMICVK